MLIVEYEKRFELKIIGHENDKSKDYHDSNWLKVSISVQGGDQIWNAEDNCLLSYELVYLRDWLSSLSTNDNPEIRFTESELAFRFNKDESKFVVVLDFHLHPKGQQYNYGPDGDDEYLLEFAMNERKLKALINDVNMLIESFPVRNK